MKRILLLLITTISIAFSNQYTFLVNKYDKEIELEAKIISNIASSIIKKNLLVFIPEISENEKKIYSKYINLAKNCNESNFMYVKASTNTNKICKNKKRIYFTNNYRVLMKNNNFIGAFFWNKSRPNVVFFKSRLKNKDILLPKGYKQFIEANK